jgi:hypothetical protein
MPRRWEVKVPRSRKEEDRPGVEPGREMYIYTLKRECAEERISQLSPLASSGKTHVFEHHSIYATQPI